MNYEAAIHMTRWAVADTLFQLDFIPEDKFHWKPSEKMNSAADILSEVVMVFRVNQPVFEGAEMTPLEKEPLGSIEEAKRALQAAADAYVAGLENARNTNRTMNTFMGPLAVDTSLLYPCIELIHHHGQITYLQGLMGDHEYHMNMEALQRYFGPQG